MTESPDTLKDDLASLQSELAQWTDQLPTHLSLSLDREHDTGSIPPPHVLSLLAIANGMRILLHRPFVSDGHLHSNSPSVAVGSFKQCATAATNIVKLVRMYDRAYSVSRAPYLISYATYMAATIQARIASKRGASSEAHGCSRTCMSVLRHNSETNYAVRKAIYVIENLMARLGVEAADTLQNTTKDSSTTSNDHLRPMSTDPSISPGHFADLEPTFIAGNMAPDLDVDAIIRSFIQESAINDTLAIADGNQSLYPGELRFEDMIFGFNASDFDTMIWIRHKDEDRCVQAINKLARDCSSPKIQTRHSYLSLGYQLAPCVSPQAMKQTFPSKSRRAVRTNLTESTSLPCILTSALIVPLGCRIVTIRSEMAESTKRFFQSRLLPG
ncbi:hypothetical protein HII31_03133 [Pseudocercospora fuligena]|uniref:Transcription factor domain-containing protein n=1 Tax=Pseudocercospora fuligena TaxID=685502 RepID=A0A8H6VPB2_9PEZI|nr:hypothetical protein HII31_03133 [Pseudocercospora fuligena]